LKPLVLDPELLRLSQDANDSQRGRLSQLGYGVLHRTPAGSLSTQELKDDELVKAQQAQSSAAEMQYERTASLVKDGIVARSKLDTAAAVAQTAAQKLRERENLIQETKAGSDAIAQAKSAIAHDYERAKAERTAELAELDARLSELRTSLLQLHLERNVMAPFGGTVVYRHPSPALAEDDQVILALAKGSGFLATVQVPAREAAMLTPGQELRMKLNHSLVSEEIIGRLQSVQPVSGSPDRRDLLIACDLPPEQFAALSKGTIPVTLLWRPALYTDRFAQAGLVFLMLSVIAWVVTRAWGWMRQTDASKARESEEVEQVLARLSAQESVTR
jgi:hypothetical protein